MDTTLEANRHLLRSFDPPLDLQEAVDRLRANLRVMTDLVEFLLTEGPPPRGKSRDDRDAHEAWQSDAWVAMLEAKLAMEQTVDHSSSSCSTPPACSASLTSSRR